MKRVGEILKEERQKQRRPLDEIAKEIKIRKQFLEAIEEGSYDMLPNPIYTRGFIRNYAINLGLDENKVLPFYRREVSIGADDSQPKSPPQPIEKPRFNITPSVVLGSVITVAIVVFLATLFWQYRSFAGAPVLIIHQPPENTTQEKTFVEVVGRTDPDAQVAINGEPAVVNSEGGFRLVVDLNDGINHLKIVAENKLGKQTTQERVVTVKPTN